MTSNRGARDGAVVRALASHQCGPGSNPGVEAICGLSLLLVLSFAPRGFSPGTPVFLSPQKPTLPNSNSIWNAWTRLNEFIWTLRCFVGKKAISNFQFLMTFKSIIDSPCLQPESYSILYLAFRTMTFLTDGHYRHNMTA